MGTWHYYWRKWKSDGVIITARGVGLQLAACCLCGEGLHLEQMVFTVCVCVSLVVVEVKVWVWVWVWVGGNHIDAYIYIHVCKYMVTTLVRRCFTMFALQQIQ